MDARALYAKQSSQIEMCTPFLQCILAAKQCRRTLEICTPFLRWMPEHSMQSRVPRLSEAQSGSGEPQSQQTALPATRLSMSIGLLGEAALANSLLALCGDNSPAGT